MLREILAMLIHVHEVRSAPADLPLIALPGSTDWSTLFGSTLAREAVQALDRNAQHRVVAAGVEIFARRQRARDLVAVLSGTATLGEKNDDGSFLQQRRVAGPEWLDLGSAWLGGGHGQDSRALVKIHLLELLMVALRELLLHDASLCEPLLATLAREVRTLAHMGHDLLHKDAGKRLADWPTGCSSAACQTAASCWCR